MPELPEVETMRRGLLGLVGGKIKQFEKLPCLRKPIQTRPAAKVISQHIVGKSLMRIDRLGKRVVLVLEDEGRLIFEPRMTGLVLIADPPTLDHLRVRIPFQGVPQNELLYWDRRGLGSIQFYTQAQFVHQFETGKLGPDALDVDWRQLRERFVNSRSAIKVALLDQKRIAGIGNLYAAEILHLAKIHPEKPCNEISPAGWKRIGACMREILETAIRYEGSTLNDGTYRNALNQTGSYQNHHRVYAKANSICLQCGKSKILRIVQAQRSTFYCPNCQRR